MNISFVVLFFFFSSRRRHTRLQGDWSSDVCSSDLHPARAHAGDLSRRRRTQRAARSGEGRRADRSEEHTSELQSPCNLVCRLLLEKKKKRRHPTSARTQTMVTPTRY